jgi:hypothetical protein
MRQEASMAIAIASSHAPSVLRAFRADEYRELARSALSQGWDVYQESGGHVAVVSPQGHRVRLSVTAYAASGSLAAKRHEFRQAGLDLRSRSERRRTQRQEARTMQVHQVPRTEVPDVTPTGTREVVRRNTPRPAGGAYALQGELETLDVGGFAVALGQRADGTWTAYTRDRSRRGGRRSWYAQDRTALLDRVYPSIATEPPRLEGPTKPSKAQEALAAAAPQAPEPEPEPEPEAPRQLPRPSTFHVVQAAPDEFPLAAALDQLDTVLAPGLVALEAAGKRDAADLVRAELVRTALEEELLALYRRVMSGA